MRYLLLAAIAAGIAAFLVSVTGSGPARIDASSVASVAAGGFHSCAVTTGGGVKCWGLNNTGQVGDGALGNRQTPVDVFGLASGVEAVTAGAFHTCARTIAGGAKCWGSNTSGQLGDGTGATFRTVPTDVSGLTSGVEAIAAAYAHTCAVTAIGGVVCWGDNSFGQLGDGTTTMRNAPVDVVGLGAGVSAIAAGGFHTCALLTTGGVKCWGYNSLGQLGDGTTAASTTPVDVTGLTGATAVAVGDAHSCALTSTGGVVCWGSNADGQLGDGTTIDRATPVAVSGLVNAATVTTGGFHTCALTSAGGVVCWGDNPFGQLGDNQTCGLLCPAPVTVSGLSSKVAAVAGGFEHTCAVTAAAVAKCWGRNDIRQLGDGTNVQRNAPVVIDVKASPTPTFTPTSTPTGPTHTPTPTRTPTPGCGPAPDIVTDGPALGDVGDHGVSVWLRTCQPAAVAVEYKLGSADWSSALQALAPTSDAADNTVSLSIAGLEPLTQYDYRIRIDGQLSGEGGSFVTLPLDGAEASFSFVVGTDIHLPQFPVDAILGAISGHDPLFAALDGDNVLADPFSLPLQSRAAYRSLYQQAWSDANLRAFQADTPTLLLWSDHEILNDWDQTTSPPYPWARAAFEEYLAALNPTPRAPGTLYYTFRAADIEFYILDMRTYRSPGEATDGPDKTMLGPAQKQDLEDWLITSTARFKFIVSGEMWNDFSQHTVFGESWPAYQTERDEIFDFIRHNDIQGVVLLSGDEHWSGVFRIAPWDIIEVAPGPLSWTSGIAPTSKDPQILFKLDGARVFGLFDVDTTSCPATLRIQIRDDTDHPRFTLPLEENYLGGQPPCLPTPTSTPTPSSTPTSTSTRTPTPPHPSGDVNCDTLTNSIDAVLVLQRVAGLLGSLSCPQNADTNRSGGIDAIDAVLILQLDAGLISSL